MNGADIPPITVTVNGQLVTIVKRGADVTNEDYDELITVEDENGTRYLVGWFYEGSVMTTNGATTDVLPDGYDVVSVAYTDASVPQNNWLLAKWLRDYYNLTFNNIYMYYKNGGWDDAELNLSCNNGVLIGVGNGEEPDSFAFYSDEEISGEQGFLNCNGHFDQEEIPSGVFDVQVFAVSHLATSSSESTLCGSFDALKLMLNGYVAEAM